MLCSLQSFVCALSCRCGLGTLSCWRGTVRAGRCLAHGEGSPRLGGDGQWEESWGVGVLGQAGDGLCFALQGMHGTLHVSDRPLLHIRPESPVVVLHQETARSALGCRATEGLPAETPKLTAPHSSTLTAALCLLQPWPWEYPGTQPSLEMLEVNRLYIPGQREKGRAGVPAYCLHWLPFGRWQQHAQTQQPPEQGWLPGQC